MFSFLFITNYALFFFLSLASFYPEELVITVDKTSRIYPPITILFRNPNQHTDHICSLSYAILNLCFYTSKFYLLCVISNQVGLYSAHNRTLWWQNYTNDKIVHFYWTWVGRVPETVSVLLSDRVKFSDLTKEGDKRSLESFNFKMINYHQVTASISFEYVSDCLSFKIRDSRIGLANPLDAAQGIALR